MIDIRKTKARILTLAFQGALADGSHKLVDNAALDELHDNVRNYQPVKAVEQLINVPKHWQWSRLGYVTSNHGQTTPTKTFSYIDVGTLDNKHQKLSRSENIIEPKNAPSRAKKIVEYGDVLYSTVRPYLHNVCIVDKGFSHTPIASTAFCVMATNKTVLLTEFLFYWLLTSEFDKFANGNPSKGTLYPAIGERALLRGVIPIPPLDEQEQIVKLISQTFAELHRLEETQSAFIADSAALKSKIVDAGMRGLLTERCEDDGDVDQLYRQLREEKQLILQQRKGRADRTIKPIDDNVPFQIPGHWKWIRFGEVGLFKKGPFGSALTKSMFVPKAEDTVKVYEQQHAIQRDHTLGRYYITRDYFDSKMTGFEVMPGDIIISCAGTIGETYILPNDIEQGIINQALMRITLAPSIDRRFFQYFFDSNLKKTAQSESNGTAINNIPPFDVLKNWYFPMPPIEEQRRIAQRIDELLTALPE